MSPQTDHVAQKVNPPPVFPGYLLKPEKEDVDVDQWGRLMAFLETCL